MLRSMVTAQKRNANCRSAAKFSKSIDSHQLCLKTVHMTCYDKMLCNSSSFVLRPTQLSGVVFLVCMWKEPKEKE